MSTDQHTPTAALHGLLADKEQPRLAEAGLLALADRAAFDGILAGLVAKDDVYRYNCFQTLYRLGEEQPQALYPAWDYFVRLLDSDNSYHRSIGAQLLAVTVSAEAESRGENRAENRLEGIFDRYFDLLDDDKIVTARQFAQHVGRIARARPELQPRITARLLAVDGTHHTDSRKDLLKGDVIAALDEFFDESAEQERILAFVEQQLACSSPRTRRAAQAFLKRHGRR
jgi:hypothetical protein